MSQNLSPAADVIGALSVKGKKSAPSVSKFIPLREVSFTKRGVIDYSSRRSLPLVCVTMSAFWLRP